MTYAETQLTIVNKLRERGIYYQYNDRLSPFWLKKCLEDIFPSRKDGVATEKDVWLEDILVLLDQLVDLRTEGKEPKHENGKYL